MQPSISRNNPWTAKNVDVSFTEPFTDDGLSLTPEMREKYAASVAYLPREGGLRSREQMIFKNVSIFDITGAKLTWSDITPADVENLQGVYYILSEHKSFWRTPEEAVLGWKFRSADVNSRSPFLDLMPDFEPQVMRVDYVKSNAIARIVDGVIQTSPGLVSRNYQ